MDDGSWLVDHGRQWHDSCACISSRRRCRIQLHGSRSLPQRVFAYNWIIRVNRARCFDPKKTPAQRSGLVLRHNQREGLYFVSGQPEHQTRLTQLHKAVLSTQPLLSHSVAFATASVVDAPSTVHADRLAPSSVICFPCISLLTLLLPLDKNNLRPAGLIWPLLSSKPSALPIG